MTNIISIHPKNPQPRRINHVVEQLQQGGVIVYPTDSGYALGCLSGHKSAMVRIRRIRQLDKKHLFTLMCLNFKAISNYARVSTPDFRLLKSHTPGPYTFVLEASKQVPKIILQPKRKTIGIRIPSHPVVQALLERLDQPLLTVSLILPVDKDEGEGEDEGEPTLLAVSCMDDAHELLLERVDLMIDSGYCCPEATSIIDLSQQEPFVLRHGQGDVSSFLS
jgi:tRNA threonylcarbamoyl adenosine modification protein (Sua5/YciO/YrdC/YwlC family)